MGLFPLKHPGASSADQKRRMEDISAEFNDITMRLDIGAEVRFDLRLPDGWSLKYEGGNGATLRDVNWRVHREVVIDRDEWRVRSGDHTLVFDCVFAGGEDPKARIELRTREPAETMVSTPIPR